MLFKHYLSNFPKEEYENEIYTGTHTCKCLPMYDSGIQSCQRGSLHCCTLGHSGRYGIRSSRTLMLGSPSRVCPKRAYSHLHPTRTPGSYIAGHKICLSPGLYTPNKGRKVQSFDRSAHWSQVDTGSCWDHLAYRCHRCDTCSVFLWYSHSAVQQNPLDSGTAGDYLSPHNFHHSDSANWHRGTSHNCHSWSQCNPERAIQRASDVKNKPNHGAPLKLNDWRLSKAETVSERREKRSVKRGNQEFHFIPDLCSLSL